MHEKIVLVMQKRVFLKVCIFSILILLYPFLMMKGTLNLVLRFKEHVIDFRLFTLDIFDVVRSVILVYLRGNYIILGGIVRGVL